MIRPREPVRELQPVVHGALDYEELREFGLRPEDVVDFSVNSNPYGPSPWVRAALQQVPLDRYPDRESRALQRALAHHHQVMPSQVLAGNGTAELIWLIALAYVEAGDRALILEPTFGEYARAVRLMGGVPVAWRARAEDGFAFRTDAIRRRLEEVQPRFVWLCYPNNPTGQVLPLDALARWSGDFPHTLFVVDEAYIHFAAGLPSALSLHRPNVLVLRSMTKDYGLAGLRLGYAVGSEEVIQTLGRVRPPWNVNAMAQAAGIAALADQAHLHDTLAALRRAKVEFIRALRSLGYAPLPSRTHFFLLPVDQGAAFRRRLLARGILVRDATSFGLPTYVRLATRRPEENQRLLDALREGE
ncbi:MAG: histidinol-phosphate aminotransferase family protein [Chloroflexi bacterium]|nr:histidinol-phosphate aminotransferase family protein [Chloroflexota bacterium]